MFAQVTAKNVRGVSLFLMHAQFWAYLDQIWYVASLYPPCGHGPVSERRSHPQGCTMCAVYIRHCSLGQFWTSSWESQ